MLRQLAQEGSAEFVGYQNSVLMQLLSGVLGVLVFLRRQQLMPGRFPIETPCQAHLFFCKGSLSVTFLLCADVLGGNCITLLLGCVRQGDWESSLATLRQLATARRYERGSREGVAPQDLLGVQPSPLSP